MSRDSYRQGADDAQHFGEPNQRIYEIDLDYTDGFNGYMEEYPIDVERDIPNDERR